MRANGRTRQGRAGVEGRSAPTARALAALVALAACACAAPPPDANCMQRPIETDIAIVGDSVFDLAKQSCTQIGRFLGDLTGEHYPDHSVGGATLRPLLLAPYWTVPRQYELLASKDRPLTVIFDGGGNDLRWFCSAEQLPACVDAIAGIEQDFRALVSRMRGDGVENIVYLGLYAISPEGTYGELADTIDPWCDRMSEVAAELGVIFVDPRPAFEGKEAFLAEDGLHPTPLGSARLAELIYEALVAEGILP